MILKAQRISAVLMNRELTSKVSDKVAEICQHAHLSAKCCPTQILRTF